MSRRVVRLLALLLLVLLMPGCAHVPGPSHDPTSLQLLRTDPDLKAQRFSLLLDFESDSDLSFVSPAGAITTAHPHTGRAALAAGAGVTTVRLASLLSGRPFPGDWTLVGLHVRPAAAAAAAAAAVTLEYVEGGKTVATRQARCAGDTWTAMFVEIAPADGDPSVKPGGSPGALVVGSSVPVVVDDVLLVDNSRSYVPGRSPWTVRRRGYALILERPGVFHMSLPTPGGSAEAGWRVDGATALRACLTRAGDGVAMTVYNDGRAFRSDDAPAAAHGRVTVPEGQGRVDRNSAGDADNDGFNEARGAYRVVARGGTVDVTLTPDKAPLDRPVLEVDRLPAGRVLATVEGRPATEVDREGETTVIVVPAVIRRRTTITVRVE